MSRRHQSSRRKAYGRRQHELRERSGRAVLPELIDRSWIEPPHHDADGFADIEPRRARFALAD